MPSKITKKGRKIRAVNAEPTVDEHMPPYTGDNSAIQKQVYLEYNLAWNFMRPKIQKWLLRLKLYNNQRRDPDRVGEPLIYETHQGVLSVLVGDRLSVEFTGRTEDEEDQGDNLNILAENDYDEMEKDKHDFEWDWDSSFFGRGLSLMNDFDTDSKTPIPTIIDPTTFIRNPGAKSVNGNRLGEGSMLFGGYEVRLTKSMMLENPKTASNPGGYFNLDKLIKTNDLFSLSGESARLRREAQGLNDIYTFENSIVENYEYSILRWFTHIPDPKTGISSKYIVELANNRMLPVRVMKLVDKDGEPKKYWPIIDRPFSPIAHDWDGVSVPDLTEDKQRFKASMVNTAGDIAKADLNGMYLFHEERFRKTQDFNFRFGKWIPVKGQGALADAAAPLQTKQVSASVQFVLNYLDNAAKSALGTNEIQNGQQTPNPQTLGESQMQAQAVGNRNSLTAKIWGWSEKEFWRHWYFVYDDNFASELGAKIAILQGAFGTKWLPINRKDIITGNTLGPKIKIESRSLSQSQKLQELQTMQGIIQQLVADPTVNTDKTYLYRKQLKLIMPKQEAERVLPLSVDEYTALEENKKLNDEEIPRATLAQDHNVHLRVHAAAADNPTTRRHIQVHIMFLMMKRQHPDAFPQLPGQAPTGTPMTPQNSQQPQNPLQKIQPQKNNVASPAPTIGGTV